jgi:hypothetical protein
MILTLTGCIHASNSNRASGPVDSNSAFVLAHASKNETVFASSGDLVSAKTNWITTDPNDETGVVRFHNLQVKNLDDQLSCEVLAEPEGSYLCEYEVLFVLRDVSEGGFVLLEIEKNAELLMSARKSVRSGERDLWGARFHRIESRSIEETSVRAGDAIEMVTRWSRQSYGKTDSQFVSHSLGVSKLWESTHCDQADCEYRVIFSVDRILLESMVEVRLLNRGHAVKTWQRKITPFSS